MVHAPNVNHSSSRFDRWMEGVGGAGTDLFVYQLTHLRTAVTSEESPALSEGTDEAGQALPGEGNDKQPYQIALEHKAKDLILERAVDNGVLFDAFFNNHEFQLRLLGYLATTYEEIRAEA